jgi:ring-1,2-phenylacetyl-CoA epoxidase subunit PaaC
MSPLTRYLLQLADNALILAHRQSEWCGHGPILEQDIAITNLALDGIGQARAFYQYAAELEGGLTTEDSLAYLRDAGEFRNFLMLELPNGDWGRTVLRTFFFSQYLQLTYTTLSRCRDEMLSAVAAKALKEVDYHLKWSREWVLRLGDGTEESHRRMVKALDELWAYTGEFFLPDAVESEMIGMGIAPDPSLLKDAWSRSVRQALEDATLSLPEQGFMHVGGREGRHTEFLGHLLADMQYLQRAHPNSTW